nr:DMT family transporter [Candidatus Njordarchaeum guaymaensis]
GLLSVGLRYVPASRAGIILLVEPISVMTMGAIILGEALTPWGILGSALVLSATILISVEARIHRLKPNKEKQRETSSKNK